MNTQTATTTTVIPASQPMPENQIQYCRLPRPGERDPIAGLGRSTLIEMNNALPVSEQFIIHLLQAGKERGSTIIVADRLRAALAREVERQLGPSRPGLHEATAVDCLTASPEQQAYAAVVFEDKGDFVVIRKNRVGPTGVISHQALIQLIASYKAAIQ